MVLWNFGNLTLKWEVVHYIGGGAGSGEKTHLHDKLFYNTDMFFNFIKLH